MLSPPTPGSDAIGATVRIYHGGTSQWRMVKSGSSYLSQSELPLTFGLGAADAVRSIEVTWPNGRSETLPGVAGDQRIAIEEGRGVVDRVPLAKRAGAR